MLIDYFLIAFKNLFSRKLRLFLTILGIIIGLSTVVVLVSLGNSLENAVRDQLSFLGGNSIKISQKTSMKSAPGSYSIGYLNHDDLSIIKSISYVDLVVGRIINSVKITFNDEDIFKFALSFPKDIDEFNYVKDSMKYDVSEGRFLTPDDSYKVVVGSNFAVDNKILKHRVYVGDNIFINGVNFKVVGILKKKGVFIFDDNVVMNEKILRDIVDKPDGYDIIVADVVDESFLPLVSDLIEDKLRAKRHQKIGEEDFTVEASRKNLETFISIISVINAVVLAIASISLLIGAIGIANTMYMNILERKKQIGVMKAIGATQNQIRNLYLIESGLIGFVGSFFAVVFGLGIAFLIRYLLNLYFSFDYLHIVISWSFIFFVLVFGFILGVVSGTLPAVSASKLNPVDVIRG